MNYTPQDYITHGWKLCLISPGKKSPVGRDWNRRENALTVSSVVPPDYGIGLMHSYSHTAALDIDDLERATGWLAMRGVYLPALLDAPDAVQIVSGKPNRAKLVYALPSWASMPSKKIIENGHVILEFRCATANGLSVQDVLPPSLHPATGQPYRWAGGGDWHALATLPEALAMLWHALLVEDCHRVHAPDGSETADWPAIVSALDAIDPDCDRQTWIEVGMAIHDVEPEAGFHLWNEWSSRGVKYSDNSKGNRPDVQWKSFRSREGGIALGSLFHHAQASGWKRPPPDISSLFSAVGQQSGDGPEQQLVEQSDDDAPLDHLDDSILAPAYVPGQLPEVYERFLEANFRFHDRASREIYAGGFPAAVCVYLRPDVRVETKPGDGRTNPGNMLSINEQAGIVGPSSRGKSRTLYHMLDHDREESRMLAWSDAEITAAGLKLADKVSRLREEMEGKPKSDVETAVANLRKRTPPPRIFHSKITDSSLIGAVAANVIHNLPTNILVNEWRSLYGGSDYKNDGGSNMADLYRRLSDNESDGSSTLGGGDVSVARMSGNIVFNCAHANIARWRGYEEAMRDGTFGRMSLYAPGRVFDGVRPECIDQQAIAAWRAVQRQLKNLSDLSLYLEKDDELAARLRDLIDDAQWTAENLDPNAFWLVKTDMRMARFAAAWYLVEELAAGRVPTGSAVIPKRYRRRAWDFLIGFAWQHQVFVHNVLIASGRYREELSRFLAKVGEHPARVTHTRDAIIGSKGNRGVRGDEEYLKFLIGVNWITPNFSGRKKSDRTRPEQAYKYDVSPRLYPEVYMKHAGELAKGYAMRKGVVDKRFGKAATDLT